MFFPGSRYQNFATYVVTRPGGVGATVVRSPLPARTQLRGYHPRLLAQRLDLVAAHYLVDPTTFWRLADANNAMVPDSLDTHDLVGIPFAGK